MPDLSPHLRAIAAAIGNLPAPAGRRLAVGVVVHCDLPIQEVVRREAQIPPSLHFARAERWMNPVLQRRLLALLHSKDHADLAMALLAGFFEETDPRYRALLEKDLEHSVERDQAIELSRDLAASGPFNELYVAFSAWLLADERNDGTSPAQGEQVVGQERVDDVLEPLDLRTSQLRSLADRFADFRPPSAEESVAVFREACLAQAAIVFALRQRAAEAETVLGPIHSRALFGAELLRVDALIDQAERIEKQAEPFFRSLGAALASAQVKHRLPERQAELQDLLRVASSELAAVSPVPPGMRKALRGPETVPDWLAWAWQRTGSAADALCQALAAASPTLARLIAETEWSSLTWSETVGERQPEKGGKAPSGQAVLADAADDSTPASEAPPGPEDV